MLFRWSLSKLFIVIYFLHSVIESSVLAGSVVLIFSIFVFIFCNLLLVCFWSNRVSMSQRSKLTELRVADATICIVVTSTQNRFNIFSSRKETIALEVVDQVRH